MSARRKTCKFHLENASGCRKGTSCPFPHVGPAGSGASPSTSQSSPSAAPRTSPSTPRTPGARQPPQSPSPARVNGIPLGACKDYWQKGECDRAFDCRFKHLLPTDPAATFTPAKTLNPLNNFMEVESLDKISTSSDIFSSAVSPLSPTAAHNYLTQFLREGYQFRTSQNMHSFAAVLCSANAEHAEWQLGDGQAFLHKIADPAGNGIIRLGEIFRHTQVSLQAGRDPNTLSFQRGYLPLFAYFSSQFVTRTTMDHDVNSLYSVVDINFDHIADVVTQNMRNVVNASSFADSYGYPTLSGSQVFRSLTTVLAMYVSRYKHAVSRHSKFQDLVHDLARWFDKWEAGVTSSSWQDPVATAPVESRTFLLTRLRNSIESLVEIVDGSSRATRRKTEQSAVVGSNAAQQSLGLLTGLELTYVGPGDERLEGPRHDNDHTSIGDIKIAPTHEELVCDIDPFLPANLPGAPHHLPSEGMARVIDIQFRLLREELIAPIRMAIDQILQDLRGPPSRKTQLQTLLSKFGGLYKGDKDSRDSVIFSVYSDVGFEDVVCDRRGIAIALSFDAPTGRARHADAKVREAYWDNVGKKRLMQGGLVALVWRSAIDPTNIRIYLGAVSSNLTDLKKSSSRKDLRVNLRVSFFDHDVDFRILQELQHKTASTGDLKILVEAPVMFESIRPFLSTLQTLEPTSIPFSRYISHTADGDLSGVHVEPPAFATRPGFTFDVSPLFESGINLRIRPTDAANVETGRQLLRSHSRMDPSQADAIVSSLTQEVALIQGPPGTGKSYTGVELLRVLVHNKIRPILLIAFTNHALDHLLGNVLDVGITRKIVRLGSRSADERISEFSLDNILSMKARGNSQSDRIARYQYRVMKEIEESIKKLMQKILKRDVEPDTFVTFLSLQYPNHLEEIILPPGWIAEIYQDQLGWNNSETSLMDYWRLGKDLDFIDPPIPIQTKKDAEKDKSKGKGKGKGKNKETAHQNMFDALQHETDELLGPDPDGAGANIPQLEEVDIAQMMFSAQDPLLNHFLSRNLPGIPPIPSSQREITSLLDDFQPWRMSRSERKVLYAHWVDEIQDSEYHIQAAEFQRLREQLLEAQTIREQAQDQARLDVLRNADLIGCTTNGAAKLTSLLKSLEPRVLMVEEAGQVLEAHILSSLVPSIQSMILIGDPLQLRPTLANYALSMDNNRTGKIYRFDQSLMERLSTTGFPMAQLNVQRRMRPTISNLIRTTLYPKLEDNELVTRYDNVRGMSRNVFFLSHANAEQGGGDESVSKSNSFEVAMIKDLVMHLLRQGVYSGSGDIVVLCAYLGQLSQIRKALSKEVTTVIDERDAVQLVDHEENQENFSLPMQTDVEQVTVSKRVTLRTVDNFQGEEGTIVILSLVRNSGDKATKRPPGIGFLKSNNRTNVALSRAKHGLYILGNANDLTSQSKMWTGVIEELHSQNLVGDGFPIACYRHPDNVNIITEPGMISRYAPDGGCLISCDAQLPCGHKCPWKCHADDPKHVGVKCMRDCQRLCSRSHPCSKRCSAPCGNCLFPMTYKIPACGHVNNVKCHQLDNPEQIVCTHLVNKKLPQCEHTAEMPCGRDPVQHSCRSVCGRTLGCCSKSCKAACGDCLELNPKVEGQAATVRVSHTLHHCSKPLNCQHICGGVCSTDHDCSKQVCQKQCRQKCSHHACSLPCSTPCPPCLEPICEWKCDHYQCPVACGSVCARLPCDKRCVKILSCNHRCPSVCGEDCESQICPSCASEEVNSQVVDMIMGITMAEIDPHGESLDEILITLDCRHVFTVETLDGICELQNYYTTEEGTCVDLAEPPTGLQKPPVCPLCRSSITARRYGRVFKRANLDMLEQHVASASQHAIQEVIRLEEKFDATKALEQIKRHLSKFKMSEEELKTFLRTHISHPFPLSDRAVLPVSSDALGGKGFLRNHRIPPELVKCWNDVARPLLTAYNAALSIAKLRSSNSTAYEAAFSTLYRHYLDDPPEDAAALGISMEEYAIQMARIGCGQAPPLADMRYRVEAFWATVRIRFAMASLAETVQAEFTEQIPQSDIRTLWSDFILFIHSSSQNDAKIAMRLANESNSHRQVLRSKLLYMRATYEAFETSASKRLAKQPLSLEDRQRITDDVKTGTSQAKLYSIEAQRSYRASMGSSLPQQEWLKTEFIRIADMIIERWVTLSTKIGGGVFYQEVTLEEKEAINRAFMSGFLGFSTTGHWYTCSNGHMYVITECGGAMEASRCPECNAPIGGGNHILDSSNQRATEMEEIGRNAGLGRSPFPWGR